MSIKRHGGNRFSGNRQLDGFLPGDKYIIPDKQSFMRQPLTCALCSKPFAKGDFGHNPQPLLESTADRVCSECNAKRVLPARIGGKPRDLDERQVAVNFFLSVLTGLATNQNVSLMAVSNRSSDPYPECLEMDSVIEAAVHKFEEHWSKPFGDKDRTGLRRMMTDYLFRTFFAKLREARVFQFRDRDYHNLYRLADVFTTMGAGYEWEPVNPGEPFKRAPEPQMKATAEYTVTEGIKVPFPEKLPFSNSYFAWGTGATMSMSQGQQYGETERRRHLIMGTLLCDDGWVFTLLFKAASDQQRALWKASPALAVAQSFMGLGSGEPLIVVERIGDHTHAITVEHADEAPRRDELMNPGWILPYTLLPWIVTYAIEMINNNDSLTKVQPGLLKERMRFKAISKRTQQKFLPPPYYTVIVQPNTYEEVEQRIQSQPREWSHRWDVRGHYGHKILRGTLPMDPKIVWQLHKRKYEVFHALNRPSGEALAILMRKRVPPPRDGEWLAYLRFWRDAFVKGPESKPYIPSVHRMRRGGPEVV